MRKYFPFLFFFFLLTVSAQKIAGTYISGTPLHADRFIGVDDFKNLYYISDNVFYKKQPMDSVRYYNLQLGNIGNIDILNPLEITVFYPDFNTVVKLDNNLNEITTIDFNQIQPFKTLQYATTANDKNLWIFTTDLQQLEIFNYRTRESITINQPLSREVIAQESNYNFCWLLTGTALLKYNSYGSLLATVPLQGYEGLSYSGNLLILKKDNRLFYRKEAEGEALPLALPDIPVKDFYINGNNLYIYDGKNLHHYQLNFSKK